MFEEDYYEYCEHEYNDELWEYKLIDEKDKIWERTCLKCGLTEQEILIVEYWKHKFITIRGKKYPALKAWGDISECAECQEVVWQPLILWDENDTSKAVTFCWKCVKNLGILDKLEK